MFKPIKEMKKTAKNNMRQNYIKILIVCFIMSIIAGRGLTLLELELEEDDSHSIPGVSEEVQRTIDSINDKYGEENKESRLSKKLNLRHASDGFIATVIKNTRADRSLSAILLNTFNQLFFDNKILESAILSVASVLTIVFWAFFINILLVGEARFFLENILYKETDTNRLLFVYRARKTLNVALVMFVRNVYNILWYFTIVGGFIKRYSYYMVPYILAENPSISYKDAILLSRTMMNGNKFKLFVLEISFLPWHILNIFTVGILYFLYLGPYIYSTKTEFYSEIKEEASEKKILNYELLNDYLLIEKPEGYIAETYPFELFKLRKEKQVFGLSLDYKRKYSLISLICIFFSVSAIGWMWEVLLYLLRTHNFVNRGTMFGPWLPIYGVGSIVILLISKKLVEKPFTLFFAIMFACSILEYLSSYLLERMFHERWWEYSKLFFNINGRVSLEGILFFAGGGCLIVYFIAPIVDEFLSNFDKKKLKIIASILIVVFMMDFLHGLVKPNIGNGITDGLINKFEIEKKLKS